MLNWRSFDATRDLESSATCNVCSLPLLLGATGFRQAYAQRPCCNQAQSAKRKGNKLRRVRLFTMLEIFSQ